MYCALCVAAATLVGVMCTIGHVVRVKVAGMHEGSQLHHAYMSRVDDHIVTCSSSHHEPFIPLCVRYCILSRSLLIMDMVHDTHRGTYTLRNEDTYTH